MTIAEKAASRTIASSVSFARLIQSRAAATETKIIAAIGPGAKKEWKKWLGIHAYRLGVPFERNINSFD